jgi:hypothetical protein
MERERDKRIENGVVKETPGVFAPTRVRRDSEMLMMTPLSAARRRHTRVWRMSTVMTRKITLTPLYPPLMLITDQEHQQHTLYHLPMTFQ